MASVKRYKFQALVTLYAGGNGDPYAKLGSAPRRMVLRGRSEGSGRSQVFTALVSCDDDGPFRPAAPASWRRCDWPAMTLPITSVSAVTSICGSAAM